MEWIKDKRWWGLALNRIIRTMAQGALAGIGTTATMMNEVNWKMVISMGVFAGISSLLTSIAFGIPEYEEDKHGKE